MNTIILQKKPQIGSKVDRRLERQHDIIEFLKKVRSASQNQIVKHIKSLNLGTRITVRRELSIMKEKEMIKVEAAGGRGKAERIFINQDSDLNHINDSLDRFERIIKQMEKPSRRIINRRYRQEGNGDVLQELGLGIYSIKTFIGLGILLKEIISLPYPVDSQILHAKILELIQRLILLALQSEDIKSEVEHLKSIFRDIESIIKPLGVK